MDVIGETVKGQFTPFYFDQYIIFVKSEWEHVKSVVMYYTYYQALQLQ